jgi:hypothetical protein
MRKYFILLALCAAPVWAHCAEGVLVGVPRLSEKIRPAVEATIASAGGKIAGFCQDHNVYIVENVDGETVIRALEQKGVEAHVKVGTPQELKENCVNFKN